VVHEQASEGVPINDLSIHGFLSDQPLSVLKVTKIVLAVLPFTHLVTMLPVLVLTLLGAYGI